MKKRCVFKFRDGDIPDLLARFPTMTAELDDHEIVSLIVEHGRAELTELPDGTLRIEFHNGYD